MTTNKDLREKWKKACDHRIYAKDTRDILDVDGTCPLKPEEYPESRYEIDADRAADWFIAERNALLEEIRKKVDGMQFISDGDRCQFSMHIDGYNQALEEVLAIISSHITNNDTK